MKGEATAEAEGSVFIGLFLPTSANPTAGIEEEQKRAGLSKRAGGKRKGPRHTRGP
jgi:hypothetical protein